MPKIPYTSKPFSVQKILVCLSAHIVKVLKCYSLNPYGCLFTQKGRLWKINKLGSIGSSVPPAVVKVVNFVKCGVTYLNRKYPMNITPIKRWEVIIPKWANGLPLSIINVEAETKEQAKQRVVDWVNERAGFVLCEKLPPYTRVIEMKGEK